MSGVLRKIDEMIATQWSELKDSLTQQIQEKNCKLQQVLTRNVALRKEDIALKDRLNHIETAQLSNNVIISGIPEQQWESYELTKQRVFDTTASANGMSNDPDKLEAAQKV